jgi:hypothetical protein
VLLYRPARHVTGTRDTVAENPAPVFESSDVKRMVRYGPSVHAIVQAETA